LTTLSRLMIYVSTGPAKLAVVLNIKVDDIDGTAAVVLDNLVRAVVGTTTDDPSLRTSLVVLDRESILVDILRRHPPTKRTQECSSHCRRCLEESEQQSKAVYIVGCIPLAGFLPMMTERY
jgi:hypothetical protein